MGLNAGFLFLPSFTFHSLASWLNHPQGSVLRRGSLTDPAGGLTVSSGGMTVALCHLLRSVMAV
jgi:hypothetical protein